MGLMDELFGKAPVSREIEDKLRAAGGDLDSMASVVLDALAENKSGKDRARARLREAEEDHLALRKDYEQRVGRGALTDAQDDRMADEVDEAERLEKETAEILSIYRDNERVYRDLLHAIERERAQGSHRLSAEALDGIRERVNQANEAHRIKDLAARDLRVASEDIRKREERKRTESREERRARILGQTKHKEAPARTRFELE